jgi:hypothetical protein
MERIRYWVDDSVTMLRLQGKSRLFTKQPDSYTEHNEGKSPIILIPGLFERWGVLGKIAKSISRNGHDVFIIPELGDNVFDIETSADIVERFIRINGIPENRHIVAHSKGGIIGKKVLNDGYADKMIAIASPFSGSDFANYFPLSSIQEMTSRSEKINELMEQSEVNKNIVSIFPVVDNLIPNGSQLKGAENILVRAKGHHKILIDKRVIRIVNDKLNLWEEEVRKK